MRRCILFETRLKSKYETMTANEKKIADYMIAEPEEMLNATTQSIGQAVGVSAATVVRFCRSCGYAGFVDLKNSFSREYHALNTSEDDGNTRTPDSFRTILQKTIGYHTLVVTRCLKQCQHEECERAIEAIIGASHIVISGEGGGKASSLCLYDVLSQMGFPCSIYFDSVFEIARIGRMDQSDLLILFSYTGTLQSAIINVKAAKERNVTVISLTADRQSPVAANSDIVLSTDSLDQDHFDSALSARMAELAVIDLLHELLFKWARNTIEGKGNRNSNNYIDRLRKK